MPPPHDPPPHRRGEGGDPRCRRKERRCGQLRRLRCATCVGDRVLLGPPLLRTTHR
eukprot:gene6426-947_t